MEINNKSSYDLSLYSKEKILCAVAAYRRFCLIKISEQNGRVVCEFQSNKISVTRLINEFDNYLIELMQTNASAKC